MLANSVDPDQTPRSMASDLCLHCLPRSQLWMPGTRGLIDCKVFTDMTDVVRVSRSSKARKVNNNVYFYIKHSSCVLGDLYTQLFPPKLKKEFFTNFSASLKSHFIFIFFLVLIVLDLLLKNL